MEMFFYGFMQRAFITGLAMAMITPILGLFLILRRQSLLADTLSHVSLVGVSLGLLLGYNPTFMTLVVVVLAAIVLEVIGKYFKGYSEVTVAILMSGGMAIALILMNFQKGRSTISVDQFLFGSIVTITQQQMGLMIALAVIVVVLYLIFRRPLYVLSFDEDTAYTAGLPVRLMTQVFTIITGVVISVMMPIAGALLVSAVIVLPASIAIRLTRSFIGVIVSGILISIFGIFTGLSMSYEFDTPPGATITCVFLIILVISLFGTMIKNQLKK